MMGLGISLRSLYPKTFESLHHDPLVFLCDRLLKHCFWRHLCHWIPTSFSFSPFRLWAVLPCYIISFSYNTMFVHHFGMGLCVCSHYLVWILVVMVLKVHWELFSDRVALVQYLFICCLLSKLMRKASFGFWISFVSMGNLFSSWEEKEDTLKGLSPHQGSCPLWDTLCSMLAGVVSAPRPQSHSAGSAVLSCGAGLFLSMMLASW